MSFIKVVAVLLVGAVLGLLGAQYMPSPDGANRSDVTGLSDIDADSVTYGKACFATSTLGVLPQRTLEDYGCISLSATGEGQAVITLTLPATSTMDTLIDTPGECREWFIDASALSAATTTTIVKGTGIDMVGLDATGAGTGADVIDGGEYGQLKLCRQTDGDVIGSVTEWINAD